MLRISLYCKYGSVSETLVYRTRRVAVDYIRPVSMDAVATIGAGISVRPKRIHRALRQHGLPTEKEYSIV